MLFPHWLLTSYHLSRPPLSCKSHRNFPQFNTDFCHLVTFLSRDDANCDQSLHVTLLICISTNTHIYVHTRILIHSAVLHVLYCLMHMYVRC